MCSVHQGIVGRDNISKSIGFCWVIGRAYKKLAIGHPSPTCPLHAKSCYMHKKCIGNDTGQFIPRINWKKE